MSNPIIVCESCGNDFIRLDSNLCLRCKMKNSKPGLNDKGKPYKLSHKTGPHKNPKDKRKADKIRKEIQEQKKDYDDTSN